MVIIGGLVAIMVSLGIAAINSTPASDSAIADAQVRADREMQRCMSGRYLGPDAQLPPDYDTLEEFCKENSGVGLSDAGVWLHDLPDIVLGISTFVILLAAWLGASLAGADWTNNTMTTLLTWEPRRIRVLATRALVVTIVVGAVLLFLQAVFVGAFALVAQVFGTTALSPPGLWSDVAWTVGRVCTMGIAIGLVAFAVAMLGKSTVASLGTLFGYLVLFEGVIAGFRPQIQSYLLVRAAGVIVSQTPIIDYGRTSVSLGDAGSYYPEPLVLLDVSRAWIVVGAYVVGLLVLAAAVFHRRDVS
jgi:hypothetical protein